MVCRINIECDCGHIISVYPQMDTTLNDFAWPVIIKCDKCNDILRLHIGIDGIKEKEYISDDQNTTGTVISCSSTLPVPMFMYLKPDPGMGMHSPFIFAGTIGISTEYMSSHGRHISLLHTSVFEYRDCYKKLLPLIDTQNFDAFSKKLKKIFGLKEATRRIGSTTQCKAAYDALILQGFRSLITNEYANSISVSTFKPIFDFINRADKKELCKIYDRVTERHNLTEWERNEAYPYIAEMFGYIESYYPAMILSTMGTHNDMNHTDMAITSVDDETIMRRYTQGYEVMAHALVLLVAMANVVFYGGIDNFPPSNDGKKYTLKDFENLKVNQQFNVLHSYPELDMMLGECFNNHIRNANPHVGVRYDILTQMVNCYYDETDTSKFESFPLIDVACQNYMAMIHIIELQIILSTIKHKKR